MRRGKRSERHAHADRADDASGEQDNREDGHVDTDKLADGLIYPVPRESGDQQVAGAAGVHDDPVVPEPEKLDAAGTTARGECGDAGTIGGGHRGGLVPASDEPDAGERAVQDLGAQGSGRLSGQGAEQVIGVAVAGMLQSDGVPVSSGRELLVEPIGQVVL
ncbi:MAG: hypothetical protein ABI251_00875 [Mycobacteriaceae bacterium]